MFLLASQKPSAESSRCSFDEANHSRGNLGPAQLSILRARGLLCGHIAGMISRVCEAESMSVDVELLWWRGCPSWERALQTVRAEMKAAGLDPSTIKVTEIGADAEAERRDFPGSPTIRIDGRDVQPLSPTEPRGLACRVYRRRDGSVSPLPDPADVRAALRKSSDRHGSSA
jgi:hypothetical protein